MPEGLHQVLPVMHGQTIEEKVNNIVSFLHQFTDQLRYFFENTQFEQFTTEELKKRIDKQLSEVVDSRRDETRLHLGNGDYFSLRKKEIYYVSGGIEELIVP